MVGIRVLRTSGMGAAAALLLVASLAGCSRDDAEGHGNASVQTFCETYYGLFTGDLIDLSPAASDSEQDQVLGEAFLAWASRLQQVGTPAAMPEQARDGFELMVSTAARFDPDDAIRLGDAGAGFTDDESSAAEAFEVYATQTCESPFGDPTTH